MKRTGFKPRVKPMASLLRTANLPISTKQRKPMKSRRKLVSAAELAHLKAVAALPCACCGVWGYSQAAHSNRYEDGKGRGIKAHFTKTFPLCCTRPDEIGCHVRHDQCIGITREEADARTSLYIADTLQKLGVEQ